MYDHILIPTDGSIDTEQAVSHGLGLARTYDATVTCCT
jgi:nucleotide-binding universal stress UspA family protein